MIFREDGSGTATLSLATYTSGMAEVLLHWPEGGKTTVSD